jgi:alkanesulfonate monooxygenase SsuD/methylene tetrahydromethanopterin reductase-like flavin-dependent oxidoreductase (luciferase family)
LETSALLTVVLEGYGASTDIGEARGGRSVTGSAEKVAEEIKRRVLDVGVDGVIINLPTHRHTPGVITELGNVLRPLVDAG